MTMQQNLQIKIDEEIIGLNSRIAPQIQKFEGVVIKIREHNSRCDFNQAHCFMIKYMLLTWSSEGNKSISLKMRNYKQKFEHAQYSCILLRYIFITANMNLLVIYSHQNNRHREFYKNANCSLNIIFSNYFAINY